MNVTEAVKRAAVTRLSASRPSLGEDGLKQGVSGFVRLSCGGCDIQASRCERGDGSHNRGGEKSFFRVFCDLSSAGL